MTKKLYLVTRTAPKLWSTESTVIVCAYNLKNAIILTPNSIKDVGYSIKKIGTALKNIKEGIVLTDFNNA